MNELALFAGAGGGILGGLLSGWRTVCAVEIDPYCRSVLLARQRDGMLPRFPVWDDVRTFSGRPWRGSVDVISGGFPCQDISAAGNGAGITGERSGLWSEFARIIGEVRPQFAFVENSPMLTSRGLGRVLGDLAEMGYDAEWCVLGADDAGAPHRRKRIWILAHGNLRGVEIGRGHLSSTKTCSTGDCCTGRSGVYGRRDTIAKEDVAHAKRDGFSGGKRIDVGPASLGEAPERESRAGYQPAIPAKGCCADVAHAEPAGLEGGAGEGMPGARRASVKPAGGGAEVPDSKRLRQLQPQGCESDEWGWPSNGGWWESEPAVGRVAHGVANRVDRLKAIGNGQVPLVAALAWDLLMERLER